MAELRRSVEREYRALSGLVIDSDSDYEAPRRRGQLRSPPLAPSTQVSYQDPVAADSQLLVAATFDRLQNVEPNSERRRRGRPRTREPRVPKPGRKPRKVLSKFERMQVSVALSFRTPASMTLFSL